MSVPYSSNPTSPAASQGASTLPDTTRVDVAVVGGGLAGTIAAVQLAARGLSAAVVDLHATPAPEFRAEQLVGPQIGRLTELGLLGSMTQGSRLWTEAVNGRRGRIMDRTGVNQFGVPYEAMVKGVRERLPPEVRFIGGRVAAIENGPDEQRVVLSSGTVIRSRLIVLATGLASVLPKRLGIENRMIRAGHSLCLGFDVTLGSISVSDSPPLIYYGESTRDRMDYLALFAMHGVIRANLFCYREQQSDWTKAFCRNPKAELLAVMPGLAKLIGDFEIVSPVQARSNDLRVAKDPARDGVVLVGDVFQTPCPAAGTGIDRLLSDIDILCSTYVPAWFATPGMGREKIAAFYEDASKKAFDAECLRIAEYRRAVSTRESLWWDLHRKQVYLRRQISAFLAKRRRASIPANSMAPSI